MKFMLRREKQIHENPRKYSILRVKCQENMRRERVAGKGEN